jgi:hypothetical protein
MSSAKLSIVALPFFMFAWIAPMESTNLASADERKRSVSVRVGQNFMIYPSNVTQTETFITRHPSNPDVLFASANTINLATGFISEGVYVTTNRGASWFGSDTCKGNPINFHSGDPGIAIDRNGRFLLIRLGTTPGLYSHFSTDNGVNWSNQRTVAIDDQYRATLASDGNPASTFHGRSYAVWIRFSNPYPAVFSYTDDGGVNWSTVGQINSPSQRGQGGEVAMGPNGMVNVCWAGVISTSPFTEDFVGFASSTDGGTSWSVRENAFDMNGIKGMLPQKGNIRADGLPKIDVDKSGGTRNGWIYIVTTQRNLAPAGTDPDIILNRSTDGGTTWAPSIRVNQDALNNGKIQYFPAIHVDDSGGVNVIYYDDRSTTSDSAFVTLSRSTDGGITWADYRISDHNFKPAPIGGLGQGYQGDNIGITSIGDTLWPVWMDNSSGRYQIWTVPIDVAEVTGVSEEPLPLRFSLNQNFPNPFNPQTTIEYEIPQAGFVRLVVYDVTGSEVAVLANGGHRAGRHRAEFNAGNLASGVYLYRITAGDMVLTRSMLLLR